jgi:hypothetical protein
MIRNLFCSMVVMTVCLGIAGAREFQARLLKVDGDTVTVQEMKGFGKKAEKVGEPVKLKLGKDAKIVAGKLDGKKVVDGDDVKDGLKNEIFSKIDGEKGMGGISITTEGEGDKERITKLRVTQKKKAAQ